MIHLKSLHFISMSLTYASDLMKWNRMKSFTTLRHVRNVIGNFEAKGKPNMILAAGVIIPYIKTKNITYNLLLLDRVNLNDM